MKLFAICHAFIFPKAGLRNHFLALHFCILYIMNSARGESTTTVKEIWVNTKNTSWAGVVLQSKAVFQIIGSHPQSVILAYTPAASKWHNLLPVESWDLLGWLSFRNCRNCILHNASNTSVATYMLYICGNWRCHSWPQSQWSEFSLMPFPDHSTTCQYRVIGHCDARICSFITSLT